MPSTHADPAHELPPPSAQRASWTASAPVRARGTAGSRAVPARRGPWSWSNRSKHSEPTAARDRPIATAKATADPALRSTSTSTSASSPRKENISHSSSQSQSRALRTSSITKCQTNPFGPQSSTPTHTHNPSHSSTAAAPASRTFFDPWNSSSTGHQRAENRLSSSTSWRDSRNLKLGQQYQGGLTGGAKRVADTVGAGSEGFGKDGRKANGGWERGASGLRTHGQKSLIEVWGASKASSAPNPDISKFVPENEGTNKPAEPPPDESSRFDEEEEIIITSETSDTNFESFSSPRLQKKQIFDGLCFYVNGSTAPLVSDHKLKHMLAAHGGKMSIAFGRRSVTHVILGTGSGNGGCGGGLAATKIQKEVARTGGNGVKFVTVHWVLESIKEGRRLSEARYSALKLAAPKQGSIHGMFCANG